jgi:hypothetical protein
MLIVLAACLVRLICLIAFYCLLSRSKNEEVVRTRSEIMVAPQRAAKIQMTFPGIVKGVISPYPTVVTVIIISHTA